MTSPAIDIDKLKIDRSRRPRRRIGPWIALLGVAGIGYAVWANRDRIVEVVKPPTTVTIRTATVVERARELLASEGTSSNGHVIARQKAALSTILPGRLVEISVEEGTAVKQGQAVARIQYDDYETALARAERVIEHARAEKSAAEALVGVSERSVEEMKTAITVQNRIVAEATVERDAAIRERDRNEKSHDEGDISEQEWDRLVTAAAMAEAKVETATVRVGHAESQLRSAQAEVAERKSHVVRLDAAVKQAEISRDSAAIDLEKTYIRAPFDGTIVIKSAEQGEVVAATGAGGNSRGSVATLVDMSTLEIQVELSEARLGAIVEGTKATVFLDIAPTKGYAGHVRQVWPTADRQTGTIEIRIVLEERPPNLRPELGARVVFASEDSPKSRPTGSVLVVPRDAVKSSDNESWVYIVEAGTARRRVISMGESLGGVIVVERGLKAGDKVVTAGHEALKDGHPVPEK